MVYACFSAAFFNGQGCRVPMDLLDVGASRLSIRSARRVMVFRLQTHTRLMVEATLPIGRSRPR